MLAAVADLQYLENLLDKQPVVASPLLDDRSDPGRSSHAGAEADSLDPCNPWDQWIASPGHDAAMAQAGCSRRAVPNLSSAGWPRLRSGNRVAAAPAPWIPRGDVCLMRRFCVMGSSQPWRHRLPLVSAPCRAVADAILLPAALEPVGCDLQAWSGRRPPIQAPCAMGEKSAWTRRCVCVCVFV